MDGAPRARLLTRGHVQAETAKEHDFKNHELPLARIKKVMKTDEDVKTMVRARAQEAARAYVWLAGVR